MGESSRSVGAADRVVSSSSLLPVLLFVLLFALLPVLLLFGTGLVEGGGLSGFASTLEQPANLGSLQNSLFQGSLSALGAFALGYPAGIFLARYSWPGRSIVRGLVLVPFLLPSLVVVLAVLDLFGSGGLLSGAWPALGWLGHGVPGILVVNLVFNAPIVMLFAALGCESASEALEETATTLGATPGRAYRDVWAGPSLLGAAAGALLAFLFSALAFAAPLVLCSGEAPSRCFTLEAQVYALYTTALNTNAASLLALAMVLVLLVPTLAYILLSRRLGGFGTPARRPRPRVGEGGKVAYALGAFSVAVWVGIAVVLGAVLYRSFVPFAGGAFAAPWRDLFGPSTSNALGISLPQVVENTLGFAALAAGIALVLALFAGMALRSRPGLARPLAAYLFLPLLISPVLLAFSLAEFWRPVLGGESVVWILIVVSQATLAIPFVMQSLEIPLFGLPRATNEVARTLGASGWQAFWDADMPLARNGLAVASLFAFALGFGEFTATYFLVTPPFTTLSVATYELASTRNPVLGNASAGAAALLLLVSLGVFLTVAWVGRSRER